MCPPGVDQTMRSSQSWQLIAPKLRQSEAIDSTREFDDGFLSSILFNHKNPAWDAFPKLARPVIDHAVPYTRIHRLPSAPSRLDTLSTELLDIVITHLMASIGDLVAFALTSERNWQLSLLHIHAAYLSSSAPWAGTNLAFQGSYSTDVPPLFEESEAMRFITSKVWPGNMCAARRFFWALYVDGRKGAVVCAKDLELAVKACMEEWKDAAAIPETRWEGMSGEVQCANLCPRDREWVLRNLTTGEVVRESGLEKDDEFGLTDVLLAQICWSSIMSDHMEDALHANRGVWAGHCFDIVTMEAHVQDEKTRDWKDVTVKRVQETRLLEEQMRTFL